MFDKKSANIMNKYIRQEKSPDFPLKSSPRGSGNRNVNKMG